MDLPEKRKQGTSPTVRKLVAIIILTSSVIAFFITLIQLFMEYRNDLTRLNETISEINITQTDTLGHLIWNMDEESIRIVINNNIKIKGIEYVELKSYENKVWKAGKVASDSIIMKKFPVYAPGPSDSRLVIAEMDIIAGVDPLFKGIVRKGFYVLLGNSVKTILVAIIALLSVKYILTRHLIDIADHINTVFEGNLSKTLKLKRKTKKKDELDLIVSALNSMAGKISKSIMDLELEVKRRKENEMALKESEIRFRSALDHIPDVVVIYSDDLKIRFINIATTVLTGNDPSLYIGKRDDEIWPEEVYCKYVNELKESFNDGKVKKIEADVLLNESLQNLVITIVPIVGADGKVKEVLGITRDLTEKVNLEMQLNHARKMESIGILAGGIAHDFNNILSIIMGYGQLLEDSVPKGSDLYDSVVEVNNAAERAKDLIKKLLAFSRKQVLNIETVTINSVIENFKKLLEKLITENISIRYDLKDNPGFVKVDVSQLEQVLINLVANARDALEDSGGEILIETDLLYLDSNYLMKRADTEPGYYAMLSVGDTGPGMDADLLDFIFDPFFTTKEKGKGTGLGLSSVYGIVKQHNGNIWVYSEPGKGSVFKIYLPLVNENKTADIKVQEEKVLQETGTVMIVEDEDILRGMIYKVLSAKGFSVIDTDRSGDAIEKASKTVRDIDIVITDVIMPDMNGPEVFKRVKKYHPMAVVLYISGYSGNLISKQGVLGDGINFLQKPFSSSDLLKKVDLVLSKKRADQKKKE